MSVNFLTKLSVDIRVGTVLSAKPLEKARKPAYILEVDFGAGVGTRKSSAQITEQNSCEDLIGRRVLAVVNFPPRQVGKIMSEVLVLGCPNRNGDVVLVQPEKDVPNGVRFT